MVILPISIGPPRRSDHGKETGNKIPPEEIQHHKISLETRRRSFAHTRPDSTRSQVDDTTYNNGGEASRSGARKEAAYPALEEDTDSTHGLLCKEASQSKSAGDGVHQPEYAYLGTIRNLAGFSAC